MRHFFLLLFSSTGFIKFWFVGHFIPRGRGISKLFLFISGTYIFRIFWLPRLWSPAVVKFKKSCDVSKYSYWNPELKYRISFQKCREKKLINMRKTMLFGKFPICTAFYFLAVNFLIKRNNSICVFCVLMRVFWTFGYFLNITTGDPKIWSQNFRDK